MGAQKWKTQSGEMMEISEMSDAHLDNAIKYSKRRNNSRGLVVLTEEQNARTLQEWRETVIADYRVEGCPICREEMKTTYREVEPHPEQCTGGWGVKRKFVVSVCQNKGCGAEVKKEI